MLQILSLPGSEFYLRFEYSGNSSGELSRNLDRPDMLLMSKGATVLVGEHQVSVAICNCWSSQTMADMCGW